MKVLLVKPPEPEKQAAIDLRISEHVGLGYLSACLQENNIPVEILDARIKQLSLKELEETILEHDFELLGISIPYQWGIPDSLKIIRNLRDRGMDKKIIVGGHPSTFFYKELLKEKFRIDFVCVGEGEKTLVELVHALKEDKELDAIKGLAYRKKNEVIFTGYRKLIDNLDELPFPARDTLKDILKQYSSFAISISGGRGCSWSRCSFCDIQTFYSLCEGEKWRGRSVKNIVDEIEMLSKKYNHNIFSFIDDDFFGTKELSKKRINDFYNEIKRRNLKIKFNILCNARDVNDDDFLKLKEIGMYRVFLGAESGVQRVLNTFKKGIRVKDNFDAIKNLNRLGINCDSGSIFIDPYTTMDEIKENFEFWKSVDQMSIDQYRTLIVFHGTSLQKKLDSDKKITEFDFDYLYDHSLDPKVLIFTKSVSFLINEYFEPRINRISKLRRKIAIKSDSLALSQEEINILCDRLLELQGYWFKDLFNTMFSYLIQHIDEINDSNMEKVLFDYLKDDLFKFKITLEEVIKELTKEVKNDSVY